MWGLRQNEQMGAVLRLKPYRTAPFSTLIQPAQASALPSCPLLLSDSPERLTKTHLPGAVLSRMNGRLGGEGRATVRVFLWHLNETGESMTVGIEAKAAEIESLTGQSMIHPNYYKVGIALAEAHLFGEGVSVPAQAEVPHRRLLGAVAEVVLIGEPNADFRLQTYASADGAYPGFDCPCAELEVHPRGAWPFSSLLAELDKPIDITQTTEISLCEASGADQAVFSETASILHDGPSRTNRGLWGVDAEYRLQLTNPTSEERDVIAEIVARNTKGVFHGAIETSVRAIIPPLEHGRNNAVQVPLATVPTASEQEAKVGIAFGGAATLPVTLRIRTADSD